MTYQEVLEKAKEVLAPRCRVCPECNGIACRGEIPGVGGKGSGAAFTDCRKYFTDIKIKMDAVHERFEPDTGISLFGKRFDLPFSVAPIGGMALNYTGVLSETEYCEATVFGMLDENSFAWTGDGPADDYFPATLPVIRQAKGIAVPTIKPWEQDKVLQRVKDLEEANAMAFAMDVDSAALVNLKRAGKPVYPKSVEQLKEIAGSTDIPFIVKGVMTARAACRAQEAGASGIVVSSHGGRVVEDAMVPASMLPEIRRAVGDSFTIFADGGIRSGADVFKCLALGADAVLIGRPYAIAAHGGGREGVRLYTQKIADELREIMIMTDCPSLSDISMDRIAAPFL